MKLCIVHLIRASLNYVPWKARKAVAADLRRIYEAATVAEAELELSDLAGKWDSAYPMISQVWRRNWTWVTPFFSYPMKIRKAIYTTNAIEALNVSCGKRRRRGGISNRGRCAEGPFHGASAGPEEVDGTDSQLACRVELLHDPLAGAYAGAGAELMDAAPFPRAPIPG